MLLSVLERLLMVGRRLPHRCQAHDRKIVLEHKPVVIGGQYQGIGIGEHYHMCSRCEAVNACACD